MQSRQSQQSGQGTNPFGLVELWANGASVGSAIGSEFPMARTTASNPGSGRTSPPAKRSRGKSLPPQERSFNSAMLDALKWSDQPSDADPAEQRVAQGLPPARMQRRRS